MIRDQKKVTLVGLGAIIGKERNEIVIKKKVAKFLVHFTFICEF